MNSLTLKTSTPFYLVYPKKNKILLILRKNITLTTKFTPQKNTQQEPQINY